MNKPNIIIKENFVSNPDSLLDYCLNQISWDERMRARKTASFGVSYDYSGITYPEVELPNIIYDLCKSIEADLNYLPNNCLLNFYPNGKSSMGYHSDSSEELKEGTGVAILSIGAERIINYKSKSNKELIVSYSLKSGALLFMNNEVQENWLHSIPKQENCGIRISLTFRNIIK